MPAAGVKDHYRKGRRMENVVRVHKMEMRLV